MLPAIAMTMLLAFPASAFADKRYVPHVRVRHAILEPILRDAIEKSATTRELVATLDASDVIVYFELNPTMPLSLHGGLVYAGTGGNIRYLRISLNPANTRNEMLAMIGHELQHAVEISGSPEVRSGRSLRRYYERIGMRGLSGTRWDTQAARDVGRRVAREIRKPS